MVVLSEKHAVKLFEKIVWNTQKNKWAIFFDCPGKMFVSIEKVLKKISEDQP